MADDADHANEYLEEYINKQINRNRSNKEFQLVHCIECGEEINELRRQKINTNMCVSCKEELEKIEKQYNFNSGRDEDYDDYPELH